MTNVPQVKNEDQSGEGDMGQKYLVAGKQVAMRKWDEPAGDVCTSRSRQYETVGFLISGKLELTIDNQTASLHPGDSWLVPAGADHQYRIIEDIVAVEATSPPARFAERDSE